MQLTDHQADSFRSPNTYRGRCRSRPARNTHSSPCDIHFVCTCILSCVAACCQKSSLTSSKMLEDRAFWCRPLQPQFPPNGLQSCSSCCIRTQDHSGRLLQSTRNTAWDTCSDCNDTLWAMASASVDLQLQSPFPRFACSFLAFCVSSPDLQPKVS